MANIDSEILRELQNISFALGDLNAIRNGEYDSPRGASAEGPAPKRPATLDDVLAAIREGNAQRVSLEEVLDDRIGELITAIDSLARKIDDLALDVLATGK